MPSQWKDSFSLNHEKIDAQHKELFRLANFMENIDDRSITKLELASLFKEFFDYMQEHFSEEEAYMKSIEYPLIAQHKLLHQDIIESLSKILKEKKSIAQLQQSLKETSHKWLVDHILNHDLKIEKWRKSITVTNEDMKYRIISELS